MKRRSNLTEYAECIGYFETTKHLPKSNKAVESAQVSQQMTSTHKFKKSVSFGNQELKELA